MWLFVWFSLLDESSIYPEFIKTSASIITPPPSCSEAEPHPRLVQNWKDFKNSLLFRSLWFQLVKRQQIHISNTSISEEDLTIKKKDTVVFYKDI